jgi:murein DD-endopeptidase MepM/ murein hydrolase activator NlpD
MTSSLPDLSSYDFAPVMNYPKDPGKLYLFDFSQGYDPRLIYRKKWGIGKYNELRKEMYVAPQFNSERNIHMGIDIWTEAGAPVFSFFDGVIAYLRDNNRSGDYGPTIIVKYEMEGTELFALYGHLSRTSLESVAKGDKIGKGEQLAVIGTEEENGGWAPHLHFQLAIEDPCEADMPGVVSEQNHKSALKKYPDPRLVLGPLY